MNIIDQIHKLSDEIAAGAETEDKLRRYIKREKGSEHGREVQETLDRLTERLNCSERDKAALIR